MHGLSMATTLPECDSPNYALELFGSAETQNLKRDMKPDLNGSVIPHVALDASFGRAFMMSPIQFGMTNY